MIIKQISVFLENRAGQLKEITECLAKNNIDLRAISIAETSDYGVVRMIANDNVLATNALKDAGFVLQETPVVVVACKDEAGGLHKIVEVMNEENIDIEYMYSIFSQSNNLACMVFRVNEPEHLEKIIIENDFVQVSKKELGI